MSYTHAIQPAIQVTSSATKSLTQLNGFLLKNSGAAHYSFQTGVDNYLLKGRNTLEIYIKPKKLDAHDSSVFTVEIRAFPQIEGVNGRTHYESHKMREDIESDALPSDPDDGQVIVSMRFRFDHTSGKETVTSSASSEAFNINKGDDGLIKTTHTQGLYRFESITQKKLENGFDKITLDFELLEDRPYTAIYTAEDIPLSDTPRGDSDLYNTPHPSLLDSLYAQTREGYDIIKAQDWEAWLKYIEPVTRRFRENPLFEGIYPPGMSADVQVEAALNNMACTLDDFPALDDEQVSPAVLFQNKLAVVPNAIYFSSSEFRYSLSIDLYYARENAQWLLAYVDVD